MRALTAIAACAATFAIGLALGNAFPLHHTTTLYQITTVDRATGQKYINDHDLTAEDCAALMQSLRRTLREIDGGEELSDSLMTRRCEVQS